MPQDNAQNHRYGDHQAPVKMVSQLFEKYDYDEFTITDSTTDYNTRSQRAEMFKNLKNAWLVRIDIDQDVTIKFNDSDNPGINLLAGEGIYEYRDILRITNIFITNASGNTVNVKIFMV